MEQPAFDNAVSSRTTSPSDTVSTTVSSNTTWRMPLFVTGRSSLTANPVRKNDFGKPPFGGMNRRNLMKRTNYFIPTLIALTLVCAASQPLQAQAPARQAFPWSSATASATGVAETVSRASSTVQSIAQAPMELSLIHISEPTRPY